MCSPRVHRRRLRVLSPLDAPLTFESSAGRGDSIPAHNPKVAGSNPAPATCYCETYRLAPWGKVLDCARIVLKGAPGAVLTGTQWTAIGRGSRSLPPGVSRAGLRRGRLENVPDGRADGLGGALGGREARISSGVLEERPDRAVTPETIGRLLLREAGPDAGAAEAVREEGEDPIRSPLGHRTDGYGDDTI